MARKGLHTVLNALARLEQNWHLHIVGSQTVDAAYSDAVRQQANTLGLASHITWYGQANDQTLNQLLSSSDLLVMPSYEGFGIVYLEAMAFGLPVLAANFGAAPEMIDLGINGYLIPPGDDAALAGLLNLLLHNRVHLATLAYNARQRYEAHPTWSQSMQGVLEWLHESSSAISPQN
jgi:glycosyltransferase involved in cell wall biosynthesis